MPETDAEAVEQVVMAISQASKYRAVAPDLVRVLARQELARHGAKEAIKEVKGRLHQLCGAFFTGEPRYGAWLDALRTVQSDSRSEAMRATCREIMRGHVSTRERLPILDRFYAETLAGLAPVQSVLDIGCGLNPLAIPWMGLPEDARYICCDIDRRLVDFLNQYFAIAGIDGHAELRDVVSDPPTERGDLALALKVLPTLDQLRRDAGLSLLRALPAAHMLVSFPGRSLGGREKGMAAHYAARFLAAAAAESWSVRQYMFPGEIAYMVTR
jgi:16S rRNA (guanine(1405)-N(7))-methyltransferase